MAQRRMKNIENHLQNQYTKAKLKTSYISDALSYFNLNEFIPPKAEQIRLKIREWTQSEEADAMILKHTEAATFPQEFPKIIAKLGILGTQSGEYCRKIEKWEVMSALFELARKDFSLAMYYQVQQCVGMDVIDLLGSVEQKQKYLSKIQNQDIKIAFALAEPDIGSDASNIEVTATPIQGGFKINGIKKWPSGIDQADIIIIYAKNTQNNQIQGFIVNSKNPGIQIEIIDNKLSARMLQNGIITFNNVYVPSEDQLPLATDFQSGVASILKLSRVGMCFVCAGMAAGTYDICVKYLRERTQFKLPLGSFQLQQERLVKILANFNAMFLNSVRLIQILDKGQKLSVGQVGMVKAWNTKLLRETVALGRDMFGGNGIISDFEIIRKFVDSESVHTAEGTYDINVLVAGRELLGINAIVPSIKKQIEII